MQWIKREMRKYFPYLKMHPYQIIRNENRAV